jgi:hypothetical protein
VGWRWPARLRITGQSTRTPKCVRSLRSHLAWAPVISNVRLHVKMTRSPTWAAVAFYPLAALVVLSLLPEALHLQAGTSDSVLAFVAKWWFGLVVLSIFAHGLFFSVHAWRNSAAPRRVFWIASFVLLSPIMAPIYWWAHSHAT